VIGFNLELPHIDQFGRAFGACHRRHDALGSLAGMPR